MPLSRRSILAGGAAATLAAGIPGFAHAQATPKRGGTLVATWGGFEPQALFVPPGGGTSPFFTSTKPLERLLALDQQLKWQPVLAQRVEPAADFRSFTVHLRRGVTWHDGKNFTAEDVVFSAMQYWKPLSVGVALNALTATRALDSHTVRFEFDRPVPEFFFNSVLAGQGGLVIPKHIYETGNIVTNPINNTPIGTGPWKYKEWVRGSHVEYVRNDNYWENNKPYLDRLFIRWWRDPASRLAAFESNARDHGCVTPVPLPAVDRLVRSGRFAADSRGYESSAWCSTIEFNVRKAPFDNRLVRQALMHAIDRQLVVDTVFFKRGRPGLNPILSANKLFHTGDVPKYDFNPAKAAQMLDAAGLRKGRNGRFSVNLLAAGWFEENGKIGQIVQQGLEDVDVKVNLSVPDRPTSLKRIYTDYDYDIALSNYTAPIEAVPVISQYYVSDGIAKGVAFRNANGFHTPAMDDLVARLTVETDPAKRTALAHEFGRQAATEVPFLPLVEFDSLTVARSDVKNISTGSNWMGETWADLWLDR